MTSAKDYATCAAMLHFTAFMPVQVQEFAGGHGVLLRCRGIVTAQELAEANQLLLARPERLAQYYFGLVDHTHATDVEYKPQEIRLLAEEDMELAAIARPGWVVCVVSPQDLQFGFSRMWEFMAVSTKWETSAFHTAKEAEQWIRDAVRKKFAFELPAFDAPAKSVAG